MAFDSNALNVFTRGAARGKDCVNATTTTNNVTQHGIGCSIQLRCSASVVSDSFTVSSARWWIRAACVTSPPLFWICNRTEWLPRQHKIGRLEKNPARCPVVRRERSGKKKQKENENNDETAPVTMSRRRFFFFFNKFTNLISLKVEFVPSDCYSLLSQLKNTCPQLWHKFLDKENHQSKPSGNRDCVLQLQFDHSKSLSSIHALKILDVHIPL